MSVAGVPGVTLWSGPASAVGLGFTVTVTSDVDSQLSKVTVTVNVVVSVRAVVVTLCWFASPSIFSAGNHEYVAPATSGV